MTILTPAEVAERAKCSVRQAFKLMRSAGAVSCRDANGNQSLRITEERFQEWQAARAPLPFAERFLPRDRWVIPRQSRHLHREWHRVYFISSDEQYVKIGYTSDLAERLNTLQLATPAKLRALAAMEGAVAVERELHEAFAAYRIHGEWFRREGALAELLEAAPQ